MKSFKIIAVSSRILLLSACLTTMVSCKEDASKRIKEENKTEVETQDKVQTPEQAEPQENLVGGEAQFEAGIKAAESNDMPLAFTKFMEAAKEGHEYAQFNIGLMYEQGLGVAKNQEEAFNWYTKSATQKNSAAQFNLGVCYENGYGTPVDFAKANAWYRKASLQGDGLAVGNLGMLYIRGDGVKENKVAGIALLIMSTTMDSSPENQAKKNISSIRGLTPEMISEAQTLSNQMSASATENFLEPLDQYLGTSQNAI
ncbi:tetratricopeptide repeat protein [Formosa sp. 3Alg 14/1]|uniref:tetratricopeptide repeat protein n=1 Tax=Formosa sp. 3Alg 14/1 TaxID=3382190 RepID=UPI0039BE7BD1